mgnify:CR=1 FL=1|jgi:hypothetical protein
MNKRLENKINRKYPSKDEDGRVGNMVWLAKHWHRWITYGCSMCSEECKGHQNSVRLTYSKGYSDINSPKGFAEMAEYAYDNYGEPWKNQ